MPNIITASAIEEGKKMVCDDTVKGHSNMYDFLKALEK
ncbi:type II toxin-antitoxin system antitoxin, RelB/DinJ family [Treponema medium]|uniref:Type II toxin-antitoxin system antitoxin, RelB/DinJ family n=1 Tax=Treponema medium TaxID=58231 RepID=A0ABX7LXZ8_TREMD|nr:type II toxin-antitoxin system antitoxin, RelB/DinJ family [Treponema medium]